MAGAIVVEGRWVGHHARRVPLGACGVLRTAAEVARVSRQRRASGDAGSHGSNLTTIRVWPHPAAHGPSSTT